MHSFSLLPGVWSPFTATVTSRVAALVLLPWNIYGSGKVATLGRVRPKKAITSEVGVNLFVVSVIIRNALSCNCSRASEHVKYSADKTTSQVSLHSRTTSFHSSPQNHTTCRNTNNESDWLLQSAEIGSYSRQKN